MMREATVAFLLDATSTALMFLAWTLPIAGLTGLAAAWVTMPELMTVPSALLSYVPLLILAALVRMLARKVAARHFSSVLITAIGMFTAAAIALGALHAFGYAVDTGRSPVEGIALTCVAVVLLGCAFHVRTAGRHA